MQEALLNREKTFQIAVRFDQGLTAMDQGDLKLAHRFFKEAYVLDEEECILPALRSYYGYTLGVVEGREEKAIRLMRAAVCQAEMSNKRNRQVDLYFNLGKFYLEQKRNRKLALRVFKKGLEIFPSDIRLLRVLRRMGTRKKPVFMFFSRDHFINRWMGIFLRRKKSNGFAKKSLGKTRRSSSVKRRGYRLAAISKRVV